ncbi:MAG: TlpA family protein disulfide reductase [Alphaproteobacteria bacterium]|nr:TlpA family protein disulfide reductase [Alphaproteobacteria bacterium]
MVRTILAIVFTVILTSGPVRAEVPPVSSVWSSSGGATPIASVTLQGLSGEKVNLAEPSGHPVLIHFWATWCAPCLAELPALDRLAVQLAGRGVSVVAVSEDKGGAADVRPALDRRAALPHVTVLLDPHRDMARALSSTTVPTTVIVDADGRERARLAGSGEWFGLDGERLLAEIVGTKK